MLTLRGFEGVDLKGKKVLMRVDFNVPFKNGVLRDNARIVAHKPTIDALLESGASVTMVSHFGRPKGKVVAEMSLGQLVPDIEKGLGHSVKFVADCVGPEVEKAVAELTFSKKRIAKSVLKVLQSAIANAENNHQLNIDKLYVSEAYCGKGLVMKRMHARGRGRGARVLKPFSNITIVVTERGE